MSKFLSKDDVKKTGWEIIYDFLIDIEEMIPGAFFISYFFTLFAVYTFQSNFDSLLKILCNDENSNVIHYIYCAIVLLFLLLSYCFGIFFAQQEIKKVDQKSAKKMFRHRHENGQCFAFAHALTPDYFERFLRILQYHCLVYTSHSEPLIRHSVEEIISKRNIIPPDTLTAELKNYIFDILTCQERQDCNSNARLNEKIQALAGLDPASSAKPNSWKNRLERSVWDKIEETYRKSNTEYSLPSYLQDVIYYLEKYSSKDRKIRHPYWVAKKLLKKIQKAIEPPQERKYNYYTKGLLLIRRERIKKQLSKSKCEFYEGKDSLLYALRSIENCLKNDCALNIDFPYTLMKQYSVDRGLKFQGEVDWGDGTLELSALDVCGLTNDWKYDDIQSNRSRAKINSTKLRLSQQNPSLSRILIKNEASMRFMNSMWHACEYLIWPTIVVLIVSFVIGISTTITAVQTTTDSQTTTTVQTTTDSQTDTCCCKSNTALTQSDNTVQTENTTSSDTFEVKIWPFLSKIPILSNLLHLSKPWNIYLIVSIIYFILAIFFKKFITNTFHYRRLRELCNILEAKYIVRRQEDDE